MQPLLELIIVDIGSLAFREPEKKDGSLAPAIGDQCTETAALALSWPGDTLLDEPAAEISIDQAALDTGYSFGEHCIRDALTPLKARSL